MGITTSGPSRNILRALKQCRSQKLTSIILSGKGGGAAKSLADICIVAPGEQTSTIQEVHMVLYHTLCGAVEAALFPQKQEEKSLQTLSQISARDQDNSHTV